jgi:hypothetical protein
LSSVCIPGDKPDAWHNEKRTSIGFFIERGEELMKQVCAALVRLAAACVAAYYIVVHILGLIQPLRFTTLFGF